MTNITYQSAGREVLEFRYTMAKKLIRERKFAEALSTLNELQRAMPQDREILYGRASCLYHMRRYRDSWSLCEEFSRGGDDPRVRRLRAALREIDREFRAAAAAKAQPGRASSAPGAQWNQRRVRRLLVLRPREDVDAAGAWAFHDPTGDALAVENAAVRDECDRVLAAVAEGLLRDATPTNTPDDPFSDALNTVCRARGSARVFGVRQAANPYVHNLFRVMGTFAGDRSVSASNVHGGPVIACGYEPADIVPGLPRSNGTAALLAAELFWPHGPEQWFAPIRRSGTLLTADAFAVCAQRTALERPIDRALGMHGLAVLCHSAAIAVEFANAAGRAGSGDIFWSVALRMWARVLQSEIFWRYIFKRGNDYGVSPFDAASIHAARNDAVRVIAGPSQLIASAYIRMGADVAAVRQMAYIQRAGLNARIVAPALRRTVQEAYW